MQYLKIKRKMKKISATAKPASNGRFWNDMKNSRDREKHVLMLASVASMIDLFNTDNIRILSGLGYKVDVAANFESGSITSQDRVEKYKKELIQQGISVYHVPIPRNLSMAGKMIKSYILIKKLADRKNYSMIHCHSPIGGVLCRLACRNARKGGTKIIYTAHGFHFFKGAGWKAWLFYYPAEKFCSFLTDVLITINHEDYRAAKRFSACKVAYVPGVGVHVDEIRNSADDRKNRRAEFGYTDSDFVFMSTGEISIRKNHEVAVRALAQIPDSRVKYLIVGFGELEDELKRLAKKLGVARRVTFAGYRSDVKELLHAVDGFVFPSLQEGLPAALMEAMAAGLPVVVSRIRGNTDLIRDGKGGYLADCHDPHDFALAMEKVINSDLSKMGVFNQKRITMFDVHKVNEIMTDIYKSCLK